MTMTIGFPVEALKKSFILGWIFGKDMKYPAISVQNFI